MKHSRCTFSKQGLADALLLGTPTATRAVSPDPVKPKASEAVSPSHLGMAGYTFVSLDLDTTLKTSKRLDIRCLRIKDFHLSSNSTDEQIRTFHDKRTAHKVTGYAVGPIYMKSEGEIDRAFDYAKWVGVKLAVGVPNYELSLYVDKKMKEYSFRYAVHLHGSDIRTYLGTADVWEHTKDLDPRIGMYLDVGHGLRNGCDPIADLKKYHTWVFDMYIEGIADSSKAGIGIEIGHGKIDSPALIRMTREVSCMGMCSLEYEKDMGDPSSGITESIGYSKAVSDLT